MHNARTYRLRRSAQPHRSQRLTRGKTPNSAHLIALICRNERELRLPAPAYVLYHAMHEWSTGRVSRSTTRRRPSVALQGVAVCNQRLAQSCTALMIGPIKGSLQPVIICYFRLVIPARLSNGSCYSISSIQIVPNFLFFLNNQQYIILSQVMILT